MERRSLSALFWLVIREWLYAYTLSINYFIEEIIVSNEPCAGFIELMLSYSIYNNV